MAPETWFAICAFALGLVFVINAAWVRRRDRSFRSPRAPISRRAARRRARAMGSDERGP